MKSDTKRNIKYRYHKHLHMGEPTRGSSWIARNKYRIRLHFIALDSILIRIWFGLGLLPLTFDCRGEKIFEIKRNMKAGMYHQNCFAASRNISSMRPKCSRTRMLCHRVQTRECTVMRAKPSLVPDNLLSLGLVFALYPWHVSFCYLVYLQRQPFSVFYF